MYNVIKSLLKQNVSDNANSRQLGLKSKELNQYATYELHFIGYDEVSNTRL